MLVCANKSDRRETLLKTEGGDDEIDRWLEAITRHVFTNFDKSVMIRARACDPRFFTCPSAVYRKAFLVAYTYFGLAALTKTSLVYDRILQINGQ